MQTWASGPIAAPSIPILWAWRGPNQLLLRILNMGLRPMVLPVMTEKAISISFTMGTTALWTLLQSAIYVGLGGIFSQAYRTVTEKAIYILHPCVRSCIFLL